MAFKIFFYPIPFTPLIFPVPDIFNNQTMTCHVFFMVCSEGRWKVKLYLCWHLGDRRAAQTLERQLHFCCMVRATLWPKARSQEVTLDLLDIGAKCQPWEQPLLLQRWEMGADPLCFHCTHCPSHLVSWWQGAEEEAITMRGQRRIVFACSHMRNPAPVGLTPYERWRHHLNLSETEISL